MAKVAYDCHVTAICSSKNVDYVKKLGADEAIDYSSQDVVQTLLSRRAANKESDLIVDCVGGTELMGHYVISPLYFPKRQLTIAGTTPPSQGRIRDHSRRQNEREIPRRPNNLHHEPRSNNPLHQRLYLGSTVRLRVPLPKVLLPRTSRRTC